MPEHFPPAEDILARLHRSGWSIGEVRTTSGVLIGGTNGENVIQATAATAAEAWWRAYEQAASLGMLR